MAGWRLEHTYADLPKLFYSAAIPAAVREPRLVAFNRPLAAMLGLDPETLAGPEGAAIFAGNAIPDGGRPIAQAYAGHQFGHFTALGDGRAILLGEQITPSGDRFDIQLKGAGQTRFSRRGDGRAALGPMLREYIISEAMHALGIPTTRSLAVVATGEPVYRESVLQGAVLTRVAASHIRVGTMQWPAAQPVGGLSTEARSAKVEALRALADYTLARHYPELADRPERYLALFDAILGRQASLIARWQLVGFIHGVMNTDNMALSGETIDYGPCAFMDAYDPATVFSSIDEGGRYAYGNQPAIAQWNLARLAEAMLPLFDADVDRAVERATEALDRFPDLFHHHWLDGMRAKLGLFGRGDDDEALVNDLLAWMRRQSADFTNTFRSLTRGCSMADAGGPEGPPLRSSAAAFAKATASKEGPPLRSSADGPSPGSIAEGSPLRRSADVSTGSPIEPDPEFEAWHRRWEARRGRQPQSRADGDSLMRQHNPAIIPRNHDVEAALTAAAGGDFSVMEKLLDVLATPYDHERALPMFSAPDSGGRRYRTFCGT